MKIITTEDIQATIEVQTALLEKCKKALRKTAKYEGYHLMIDTKPSGNAYYTIFTTSKSNRHRKNIGRFPDKNVRSITERTVLLYLIRVLERNLVLLNRLLAGYKSTNPNEIREHLPRAYQDIPDSIFEITETIDMSKVAPARYFDHSAEWSGENLKLRTADGHLVRSKNELLAIAVFNKYNISFTYEESIFVNGRILWPDFIIVSPDGKKRIIIEIFGKMDDVDYRRHTAERVGDYIAGGYTPDVDAIFIYCNGDQAFDIQEFEHKLLHCFDQFAIA